MYEVMLTDEFQAWLDALTDRRIQLRIVARIRRATLGNLGDWKSIAGRLCEMRVDDGPGYRLYFARQGEKGDRAACRRRQIEPGARHSARTTTADKLDIKP